MNARRISIVSVLCGVFVTGAVGSAAETVSAFLTIPAQPGQWAAAGDGAASATPGTFLQDGATPFTLTLRTAARNGILTGQVMLPGPRASIRLALPAAEDGKPLAGTVTLQADGKTLNYGRKDEMVVEDAPSQWLPMYIAFHEGDARISLPGGRVMTGKAAATADGLTVTLTRGAKVRDLRITELPARMQMLDVGDRANVAVVGADAPVGRLDPAALPAGRTIVDGVPFQVLGPGERTALDVATSMSGQGNQNLKAGYRTSTSLDTRGRLCVKTPGAQYSAMHVLAFSAGRAGHAGRMTVRVGFFGGASAILQDTVVDVPLLSGGAADDLVSRVPVRLADGREGHVHHLRVPMDATGNVREFAAYDVEFTRDLHVTGSGYGPAPAGLPSDVVLLAATMERSPVDMAYSANEGGNVFHEDQEKVFTFTLTNRTDEPASGEAFVRYRGPGTGEEIAVEPKDHEDAAPFSLAARESQTVRVPVTPKLRGWYSAVVGIEVGGQVVQRRDTSLAVLAPDTRKAFEDSPFGVWCFWRSHASRAPSDSREILAGLMNKAGWRYTYGGGPVAAGEVAADVFHRLREDYKIIFTTQNLPNSYQRATGWYDEKEFNEVMPKALQEFRAKGLDPYCKVLHESRSSSALVRWVSPYFTGRPYPMSDAEKQRLDQQFENVKKYCLGIKRLDPTMKIVLFNDYPAMAIEYLKRGFPKEAFDVIGLEGAMFERAPERQPDWLCLSGQIIQMQRAMKQYGYDKPIWMTEAMYHPTSEGALPEHDQGVLCVREAMLALALGVQRLSSAGGIVADSSDDYHWSPWGSSGYVHRDPEYNPKPSYATYAWMTQLLDQARYDGYVETGSTALYVLRFRLPGGACVYPLWTARGRQGVALKVSGPQARLYDVFGNPLPVQRQAGVIRLTVGDAPQYLAGVAVDAVASHAPVEVKQPLGEVLLDFDDAAQVRQLDATHQVLESSGEQPRIKGKFVSAFDTEDDSTVLRATLKDDNNEYKLLPRYVEFALAKPIPLKGRPYALTARVKGNGSWGRLMFELTDAEGRVWTSCGNIRDISSADVKGRSFFNFDGWHTIRMPVMGKFIGDDQKFTWPDGNNWWASDTPEYRAVVAAYEQAAKDYPREKADYDAAVARLGPQQQEALKAYRQAAADHAQAVKKAKAKGKKTTPPALPAGLPLEPVKPEPPVDTGAPYPTLPLTLTKIIVTMRPHVLYVNAERPIADRSICIDKIGVLDAPDGY